MGRSWMMGNNGFIRAPSTALTLLILLLEIIQGFAKAANRTTRPPALIVFGDSIVDPGNNNAIITPVRCNFPPYGKDFVGHKATGRFSNGKIPSDIIASLLGIKEHVPAYLGTKLDAQDLLTGVSFASGGGGYDPLTAELVQALTLDDQLNLFKEYKEKLRAIAGEKKASTIISRSLYIVVTGNDDIANTYFTSPFRRNYDLSSYIRFVVQSASSFFQKLYRLGARRIGITGLPPVGCLPSQRSLAGGIERECVTIYNQAATTLNSELQKEIQRLNHTLAGSRIVYIDMYTPLLDMIIRPFAYGFEEVKRGCCGTGILEVGFACNSYTAPLCDDVSKYLFWDVYHPTEMAYNILMRQVQQRYSSLLASPAFLALGALQHNQVAMGRSWMMGNNGFIRAPSTALTLLILLLGIIQGLAKAANRTRPPALIVFGDSIVDPGNNNAIITTVRCNFPPYGKDFVGHKATGRFSNGKIPSDILASLIGIKEYVPAYLGTKLDAQDLLTGVSFASGGGGYDPLTAQLVQALTMDDQLNLFKEYKEKLKAIAGEKKASTIISRSLYIVVTGNDDIANTYFTSPFRRNYDLSSYIRFVVQSASSFFQKLYRLGARRIGITGLPPVGCLPSQRSLAGGIERDCVTLYNQASKTLNSELQKEIQRLNHTLAGSRIVYIDMYTPLLDMIIRPFAYGFEEVKRGCCGTGIFEVTFTCNSYTAPACDDVSKYLFWDVYHPTERAYNILMRQVQQRYSSLLLN
ncbi:uncharacterized protein LOC108511800 [Phoenix dactylifera]|uniref:Uncharacterized protein LOC108511800 n=1 Tax=Phoenix dactylifera TaxID=42345 RepID=A0A8B7MX04_PHODC|nr:uncharacterized protein LOC108511800 [Phoenix dactylifera]